MSTGIQVINTENTFMKAEGFAAQTFSKYAVSTGYGTTGKFRNVCLPQESKHDANVLALRPGQKQAELISLKKC